MPNNITLFKKYITLLDEVYKAASKTSILDGDSTLVKAGANANEIIIPKIEMDGLAEYSRNDGYVHGNVTITNETVQFNYDRGRKFTVDAMDNEETAGIAFGKLSSSFIREKVVPEMDAFRFAKYASIPNISSSTGELADGNAVLAALVAAQSKMDEDEVPEENRILFITPSNYNAVHAVDTTKSREVLASFAKIIKVPQSRFYTAIELLDGTSDDETAFNYYGFEAHQTILNATHNRIAEASEAVKACMFKLIGLASNFDVTTNGRVTSSTHDGLSQSFAVPTSAEYLKEANDIIKSYLMHEVDKNGIPLLYAGVNIHD